MQVVDGKTHKEEDRGVVVLLEGKVSAKPNCVFKDYKSSGMKEEEQCRRRNRGYTGKGMECHVVLNLVCPS